jgi:hypothetical protein
MRFQHSNLFQPLCAAASYWLARDIMNAIHTTCDIEALASTSRIDADHRQL